MAYFAELDENNIVLRVVSINNSDIVDPHTGEEDEILGIAHCKRNWSGKWKQTSYNDRIRGNYAGVGDSYLEGVATLGVASTDVFMPPKNHASWGLSTTVARWEAPISKPALTEEEVAAGKFYIWNEEAYQADTNDPKTVGWAITTF